MAFIKKSGNNILLNQSRQTVMNNQPLFAVGNAQIAGYVSVEMYDQISSSVIGSGPTEGSVDLFIGTTEASGKPYVIVESVKASYVPTA
jgi:hypothetical protein